MKKKYIYHSAIIIKPKVRYKNYLIASQLQIPKIELKCFHKEIKAT